MSDRARVDARARDRSGRTIGRFVSADGFEGGGGSSAVGAARRSGARRRDDRLEAPTSGSLVSLERLLGESLETEPRFRCATGRDERLAPGLALLAVATALGVTRTRARVAFQWRRPAGLAALVLLGASASGVTLDRSQTVASAVLSRSVIVSPVVRVLQGLADADGASPLFNGCDCDDHDPHEGHSLFDERRDEASRMRERLNAWELAAPHPPGGV